MTSHPCFQQLRWSLRSSDEKLNKLGTYPLPTGESSTRRGWAGVPACAGWSGQCAARPAAGGRGRSGRTPCDRWTWWRASWWSVPERSLEPTGRSEEGETQVYKSFIEIPDVACVLELLKQKEKQRRKLDCVHAQPPATSYRWKGLLFLL